MLKFFNANQKNFSKKLEAFLSSRKFSQQNKSISVKKIISEVKKNGDAALIKYEKKFSNIKIKSKKIKFSKDEINKISKGINKDKKKSIDIVYKTNQKISPKAKIFKI